MDEIASSKSKRMLYKLNSGVNLNLNLKLKLALSAFNSRWPIKYRCCVKCGQVEPCLIKSSRRVNFMCFKPVYGFQASDLSAINSVDVAAALKQIERPEVAPPMLPNFKCVRSAKLATNRNVDASSECLAAS